jgi:hypothetical protein
MGEAGTLAKLQDKLAKGVAHFTFQKTNGDHREAFGTTNGDIIPKYSAKAVENLVTEARDFHVGFGTGTLIQGDDEKLGKAIEPFLPKEKKQRTRSEEVVTFFDVEKQGWRSCRVDSILGTH